MALGQGVGGLVGGGGGAAIGEEADNNVDNKFVKTFFSNRL